jgi:drug/metabolite transporter (DMT)-like permease
VLVALAGVVTASHAAAPGAAAPAGLAEAARGALASLGGNVASNPAPYVLCLVEIFAWALYSNLAARLAPGDGGESVPVFVLAAGVLLAAARLAMPEHGHLNTTGWLELAFMAAFPGLLAYVFWERAMKGPGMVLVTSLSYLIPLFSTLLTCWRQGVPLSAGMVAACALVIGGAALCRLGVRPAEAAAPAGAPATDA